VERPVSDVAFLSAWSACAAAATRDALSPAAMLQARRSWVDTAAAMLGGTRERGTTSVVRACLAVDAGQPLRPWDDALVLGTAAHALDYDDVCMLATCHPSAPVVAALLALLPVVETSRPALRFDQMLGAYLVGTETMLRLGEWLGFRHYALGFHATGTLGVVGAAAACAHALDLPETQARAALAIAASSAGGLRANFGTDTKPLHVGLAASAAVRAVLLARAGANASDDVWGEQGFALAFGGGVPPAGPVWRAGGPWAIESPGFEHKRFPSCYLTHRLVAGLLRLREGHGGHEGHEAGQGEPSWSIDVELPKNGLAALKYTSPTTGLQGKFSGEYCAAAAWHDGSLGLGSFTDQAVRRPAVRALMERVTLRERDGVDERLDHAPVRVRVRRGRTEESVVVDWAPGSLADPMSAHDLKAKWRDCACHAGVDAGTAVADALFDAFADRPASGVFGPLRSLLLVCAGVSGAVPTLTGADS
jgi:2-methylcitrate dehydratase PrpD